jgi:hypothetical protein
MYLLRGRWGSLLGIRGRFLSVGLIRRLRALFRGVMVGIARAHIRGGIIEEE